jgi:hypothetical protein
MGEDGLYYESVAWWLRRSVCTPVGGGQVSRCPYIASRRTVIIVQPSRYLRSKVVARRPVPREFLGPTCSLSHPYYLSNPALTSV